jgi:hypothetical protein
VQVVRRSVLGYCQGNLRGSVIEGCDTFTAKESVLSYDPEDPWKLHSSLIVEGFR